MEENKNEWKGAKIRGDPNKDRENPEGEYNRNLADFNEEFV